MRESIEFFVEKTPMSLNDLIGVHWSKIHPQRESWALIITAKWLSSGKKILLRPVTIHYTIVFNTDRTRDDDNYIGGTKFINDALKRTFIKRDDHFWLRGITIDFKYAKKEKSGTRILIEEVEE